MNENGATVGRYTLRQRLGSGGFGAVYRAYDATLEREVALKVLHPSLAGEGDTRERFIREGRALARVKHPNVVTVYEAGEADGQVYLATDLIEGISLAELLEVREAIPLAEVLGIADQIAAAIAAVHARGLIHRDIKPANVLVERESGRAVLLDLGIARDAASATLTRGDIVGTPTFMAPEQIDPALGSVSVRTDVYQFGATVYALLAGRAPYEGDTTQVLYAVVSRPPPDLAASRPDLPVAVVAAIGEAMAKDPGARPEDAPTFARRLRAAAAGAPVPTGAAAPGGTAAPANAQAAIPPSREQTVAVAAAAHAPGSGRSHTLLILFGLLVLATVAGVVLLSRGGGGSEQEQRAAVATPLLTAAPVASTAAGAPSSPAPTTTPVATTAPTTAVPASAAALATARTPLPSPTPSPTPTPRPTAAPDTPAGSLAGQRVTSCTYGVDFEITVASTEWLKSLMNTAAPGNAMWLVALIDVTNAGTKQEGLVTRPLKVRDGRGREFAVKEYPPDPVDFSRAYGVKGPYEYFQPGITERSVVAFQVPADAGPLTLRGTRDFC